MAIRIKARGGESVEQMMRRFKKLCEKEGLREALRAEASGHAQVRGPCGPRRPRLIPRPI